MWYQNVEIEYIPRKSPTLTIYDEDGEESEIVLLDEYDTSVQGLHELFVSKGFVEKSNEEIEEIKRTLGDEYKHTNFNPDRTRQKPNRGNDQGQAYVDPTRPQRNPRNPRYEEKLRERAAAEL